MKNAKKCLFSFLLFLHVNKTIPSLATTQYEHFFFALFFCTFWASRVGRLVTPKKCKCKMQKKSAHVEGGGLCLAYVAPQGW